MNGKTLDDINVPYATPEQKARLRARIHRMAVAGELLECIFGPPEQAVALEVVAGRALPRRSKSRGAVGAA